MSSAPAVCAAARSDLVHTEVFAGTHKVCSTLRSSTVGAAARSWSEVASQGYVIRYLPGENVTNKVVVELQSIGGEIGLLYLDGESTYMWLKDLRETYDLGLQSKRSPFIEHRAPSEGEVGFVRLRVGCRVSHSCDADGQTMVLGSGGGCCSLSQGPLE